MADITHDLPENEHVIFALSAAEMDGSGVYHFAIDPGNFRPEDWGHMLAEAVKRLTLHYVHEGVDPMVALDGIMDSMVRDLSS